MGIAARLGQGRLTTAGRDQALWCQPESNRPLTGAREWLSAWGQSAKRMNVCLYVVLVCVIEYYPTVPDTSGWGVQSRSRWRHGKHSKSKLTYHPVPLPGGCATFFGSITLMTRSP